jgi:hypothetical protein
MTDEGPVRRFAEAVRAGKVYGPYTFEGKDGSPRKPFWMWIAKSEEAWRVSDLLWPWLSERRMRQMDRVFALPEEPL